MMEKNQVGLAVGLAVRLAVFLAVFLGMTIPVVACMWSSTSDAAIPPFRGLPLVAMLSFVLSWAVLSIGRALLVALACTGGAAAVGFLGIMPAMSVFGVLTALVWAGFSGVAAALCALVPGQASGRYLVDLLRH
jgi:hypothetical protein